MSNFAKDLARMATEMTQAMTYEERYRRAEAVAKTYEVLVPKGSFAHLGSEMNKAMTDITLTELHAIRNKSHSRHLFFVTRGAVKLFDALAKYAPAALESRELKDAFLGAAQHIKTIKYADKEIPEEYVAARLAKMKC